VANYTPFERRHRSAARWALYSSLAISGLIVFAAAQSFNRRLGTLEDASGTREEWAARPEVDLLRRYIQIDTSEREIEGALFLAEELRRAGLEPVVEELGDGRANLWAILEGRRREAIVLHNHIDVFGVRRPDAWEFEPFGGEIESPFMYGRGAFDMKSLAIAQLLTIRDLAARPRKPERSVIFLATADEETGSRLGARWVLREQPELVERFDLVLTEGGIIEPVSVSEVKYWGIETAQKRFAPGEACFRSREPLQWLYEQLRQRQHEVLTPVLTSEVKDFVREYRPTRQREYYRRLLGSLVNGAADPAHFRLFPAYLRSLFLNEIVPFPVERVVGGGYRLPLVAHLLPGADFESVMRELLPPWLTHGLDVRFDDPLGADAGSPTSTADYRILEAALSAATKGAPVGPYFLSWSATDGRFFRQAGVPTYGFSPFLLFSIESYRADTINERINLPGFVDGIELYKATVRRLADTAPSP
jgi:acetylornithine deacetylase/succinyl-diaminopimelate desuccinylase-like protein